MQNISKNNWRGLEIKSFLKKKIVTVIYFWTEEQGEMLVTFFTDKETDTVLKMKVVSSCVFLTLKGL